MMRNIDRRTCLAPLGLLLGLVLPASPVLAEADGPDYFRVRDVAADDVLYIRDHPSPHAAKVGEIPPQGTCIRNLGCRGGLTFQEFTTLGKAEQEKREQANPRWCRIEYRGTTGWAAGRYLAEGACD
jgi:hypothetical protein